jgi:hypothetical protein
MNRGLSYALTLRAIGQSLEAQQTKDFDLSALETGFIVRENERRSLKWRRTIRSNGIGEMLDLSDVHYSVDDIAILDQSGKERRRTTAQTPNFYLLSQTLRTVGGFVDRRGVRLLELSLRGVRLTLRLEQPEGPSLVEEHTVASLHSIFVGMFFDRQKKSLPAIETPINEKTKAV